MDYNFSLFSKICGFADPDNDVTLWVLLNLYEEWIQWNSRFGLVYNTQESMEQFLLEVNAN
jgi:hypothetical protein